MKIIITILVLVLSLLSLAAAAPRPHSVPDLAMDLMPPAEAAEHHWANEGEGAHTHDEQPTAASDEADDGENSTYSLEDNYAKEMKPVMPEGGRVRRRV